MLRKSLQTINECSFHHRIQHRLCLDLLYIHKDLADIPPYAFRCSRFLVQGASLVCETCLSIILTKVNYQSKRWKKVINTTLQMLVQIQASDDTIPNNFQRLLNVGFAFCWDDLLCHIQTWPRSFPGTTHLIFVRKHFLNVIYFQAFVPYWLKLYLPNDVVKLIMCYERQPMGPLPQSIDPSFYQLLLEGGKLIFEK
jgi:hypothetical protein